MFFWAVIAINTFIDIVWEILPLEIVLLIYAIGGIGVLLFGFVSHKAKVGRAIVSALFDIEHMELWDKQTWVLGLRIADCIHMEPEQRAELREKYERQLNIWSGEE